MTFIRKLLLPALLWLLSGGSADAARIVAIGDVHGEIDGFDSILRAAALTDGDGRWVGGDAILVQTGDVTDRGARVRAVIDRLRSLQEQAPAQGGRVVPLLGNHEFSNLIHLFDTTSTPAEVYHQIWADFAVDNSTRRQKAAYRQWYRWNQRYPGCVKQENQGWIGNRAAWLEDHPPGFVEYVEAFSAAGEYGRWLRGLDVAVEVEGAVFLHGGISPQLVERGLGSVAAITQAAAGARAVLDTARERLIDEEVILPFSTLWETHCAVFVEMARLEEDRQSKAVLRLSELREINDRLPGTAAWFPTQVDGPLWYRGLATADEAELAPQLDGILAAFGARLIAVGHTPQVGEIRSRFDGRVLLIDTAMAYPELGGRAAALEIDGDRLTAIYPDERVPIPEATDETAPPPVESTNGEEGRPVESTNGGEDRAVEGTNGHGEGVEGTNGDGQNAVEPAAARQAPAEPAPEPGPEPEAPTPAPAREVWLGPDGEPLPFETVEEVVDFLATASVHEDSGVGTGITLPRKLLLERDGVRAHAIFHTVALEKRREKLRGGKIVNFFRDHYANNVAAFELSRMLGLTNVPPAVVRKVGRDKGSVQLWIEGSHTEQQRRELGIDPPGDWRLTAKDMVVFDNLINNIDRNQGNILFDANWDLWFIDHTRAFSRVRELPSPARVRRCSRQLLQALRDLDPVEVQRRLKPLLGIYEIRGLLARRDLLLDLIEERMTATSEMAVLFDYDEETALAAASEGDPEIPQEPDSPPSG